MELTDQEFDRLISKAMDDLPQEYIKGLNNVAILYADDPDEYQIKKSGLREGNILLGLYEGIPLTKRGGNYTFVLPDKITLFKHSMMMVAQEPHQLYEQIKRTLWHEIAHYYGLDHARIHGLERGEISPA
ncbi:metallopeptidase family protein [Candidatus Saccharibacteria bacterium]|nr:metallopeptidase family protein [Candidatus Saccharibacteria bacterium]